jgi:hypothetical protein
MSPRERERRLVDECLATNPTNPDAWAKLYDRLLQRATKAIYRARQRYSVKGLAPADLATTVSSDLYLNREKLALGALPIGIGSNARMCFDTSASYLTMAEKSDALSPWRSAKSLTLVRTAIWKLSSIRGSGIASLVWVHNSTRMHARMLRLCYKLSSTRPCTNEHATGGSPRQTAPARV